MAPGFVFRALTLVFDIGKSKIKKQRAARTVSIKEGCSRIVYLRVQSIIELQVYLMVDLYTLPEQRNLAVLDP